MTDAGIDTCTVCGEPVCGEDIYPGPAHAGCYEQSIRIAVKRVVFRETKFTRCHSCGKILDLDDEALGFCEDC